MKLEFKFHPAGQHPGQATAIAAFLAFMAGALLYLLNSPILVALLIFVVTYNFLPYYFPTYYKLDEKALTMSRLGKDYVYLWDDYRSYTVQKNGIVIWADATLPQRKDGVKNQMKALRRSVFFPMTPEIIEASTKLLRQKLVLTKQDK